MKSSLRTLEQLEVVLSSGGAAGSGAIGGQRRKSILEAKQVKEAVRQMQLGKLTPYKRSEYLCLEAVGDLREALHEVEELQYTLNSDQRSASGRGSPVPPPFLSSREDDEALSGPGGEETDEERTGERTELLGGHRRTAEATRSSRPPRASRPDAKSGETNLLQHELARARLRARRAYQKVLDLQREAIRQLHHSPAVEPRVSPTNAIRNAQTSATGTPTTNADDAASRCALETLDWQQAERHAERARAWYRDLFGIQVMSSTPETSASAAAAQRQQLHRPAQLGQSPGSLAYVGSGANPLPPGVTLPIVEAGHRRARSGGSRTPGGQSPARTSRNRSPSPFDGGRSGASTPPSEARLMLRSAREDHEFQQFFSTLKENDAMMEAALDRLGEGIARVMENARGIQNELTMQEGLLSTTEVQIEANQEELVHMNRRLRRALREMEDSSVCVYVSCLLMLLLLLAVLLRLVS